MADVMQQVQLNALWTGNKAKVRPMEELSLKNTEEKNNGRNITSPETVMMSSNLRSRLYHSGKGVLESKVEKPLVQQVTMEQCGWEYKKEEQKWLSQKGPMESLGQ